MKKKLEKDIQREICDWLFERGYFFWRVNNTPIFDKGHFRPLPKYTPRGIPDIIVIIDGHFIGLEVKRALVHHNDSVRGVLSPHQKAFGEKVMANGGTYAVVTNLAEARDIVGAWPKHEILSEHARHILFQ